MMKIRTVAVLSSTLALGSSLFAQNAEVDQTFPFFGCLTATSDGQLDDEIYAGLGGGIVVLTDDSVTADPELAGGNDQLRSGGVTCEISLTSDSVYVAAGKRGLVRFPRLDLQDKLTVAETVDAEAVDATSLSEGEIVLVGTNDSDADGMLHLVTRGSLDDQPELQDSDSIGAPIHALASYVHDDTLTVLVGTACASTCCPGATASLWRYDLDVSSGLPTALPNPTAYWSALEETSPGVMINMPTFVRDIVIDAEEDVAFVAAHERGVYRLSLATGGLVQTTSAGWPIMESGGGPYRYVGLALHKPTTSETLLAASLGETYPEHRQEWGTCDDITICSGDDIEATSALTGIRLFEVSATAPVQVGSINVIDDACRDGTPPEDCPVRLTKAPTKLSVRAQDGNSFRLDVVVGSHGLQVVQVERDGGDWSLSKEGSFDEGDGFPVGSCDDVIQMGDDLIASFERGVIAFDVEAAESDPTDPEILDSLSVPASLSGSILLAGLSASGYPKMVFGSEHDAGVRFSELRDVNQDGKTDAIQNLGVQPTNGKCYSQSVVPPNQTPDGKAWLLAINTRDNESMVQGNPNSGLRLYRLTATGGHVDPGVPTDVQLLASYSPDASEQEDCEEGEMGSFLDGLVGSTSSSNLFSVWVTYGPRDMLNEKQAGLLTLKGTFHHGNPRVTFEFVGKTPLPSDCDQTDSYVGRLTMGSDGRMYAAYGCHGIAAFSPESPGTAATLEDVWDGSTSGLTALHARLGMNNRVFVTFLNDRIAAFNASDLAAGPLAAGWADTEYQPNALWPAPSSLSGKPAFWVADGKGGLHRLQYLTTP